MNNSQINNLRSWRVTADLALGACIGILIATSPLSSAAERDSADLVEKMKQWQEEMSDKFRDTWKGWRGKDEEHSAGAASIDLREQKDSYTLRLNLPDRDIEKVDIKLDRESLHIIAPAGEKTGRYEQVIRLPNVPANASVHIERKPQDNLIVATVPKGRSVAESKSSPSAPSTRSAPWEEWERDAFSRMDRMRREMDRIFDESFKEFRLAPEQRDLFDRPRFGSSLDVQEEGDRYVVRAYLPGRNMKDVNVTVEGQTLKVEAKAEEIESKEEQGIVRSQKGHYSQVVTLPGPVQADKMNVEKKEGVVVVTLPKA